MLTLPPMKRVKLAVLAALITANGTVLATCGLTDLKKNIIKGTLDFVSAYTQDVWDGITPTPPNLFP
jgi:hypothetical protein